MVNRILSFLGEISFSIYLVHFAVLRATIGLIPTALAPTTHLLVLYATVLSLSSLVAWLTYSAVERPMISVGRRLTRYRGPKTLFECPEQGEAPVPGTNQCEKLI